MAKFNDTRFVEWHQQFNALIEEYMSWDGSNLAALNEEFTTAIENAQPRVLNSHSVRMADGRCACCGRTDDGEYDGP